MGILTEIKANLADVEAWFRKEAGADGENARRSLQELGAQLRELDRGIVSHNKGASQIPIFQPGSGEALQLYPTLVHCFSSGNTTDGQRCCTEMRQALNI